jgi:hypothetical protein
MTVFNIGKTASGRAIGITARFAARHGLIAGATGTGKSYTIARLVEQMVGAGIPVFLVDVKGDLSGIARSTPCQFFAPAGQPGALFSIRADDMGADAMARALQLTDAQSGALEVLFAWTRARGRRMGSLGDVTAAVMELERNRKVIGQRYGHVAPASVAVIRRALLRLRAAPCELFGKSSFNAAWLDRPGIATILDATRLYQTPALYGAAVLYLLQSLYDRLPEIGDMGAPRMVLFLDEAHLIFSELAPALLQRVERIVRLIRSKGVAIYFASQSPGDIPAPILAQLGNRIQHGLRGATLQDLRGIRAAAETMPINPAIDAASAILSLGMGQALVSTIGPDGIPSPVEIVQVQAPAARMGPIDAATRAAMTPAPMQPLARAAASSDVLLNNLVLFGIVASPFVLVTALAIWATIAYPY